MTKPLDPELKALRAIVRVLDAVPDDRTERRMLEWLIAERLGEPGYRLPPLMRRPVPLPDDEAAA